MADPHTDQPTQGRIQELQWELLEHPPYSPDLAPSDSHLFGPLKYRLRGKRSSDDEDVETEVRKWQRRKSKDLYAAGFDALAKRRNKCISVGGGYVEKQFSSQVRISNVLYPFVPHLLTLPRTAPDGRMADDD
ncbi:histone-lysine N-methyltransferase SETMAR-like [Cryptotermes secundus]|uniref:histone-lysine N-methyltransferase SETMAR-like n=1 Tax=Cryptotermes secundus TaxID=105785 RepID=UPI000CD7C5D1|nr:histone-lysine N-methyltransferase SETMAR-like [Cryptotermes secundus]